VFECTLFFKVFDPRSPILRYKKRGPFLQSNKPSKPIFANKTFNKDRLKHVQVSLVKCFSALSLAISSSFPFLSLTSLLQRSFIIIKTTTFDHKTEKPIKKIWLPIHGFLASQLLQEDIRLDLVCLISFTSFIMFIVL
jgi:hypothetical protein